MPCSTLSWTRAGIGGLPELTNYWHHGESASSVPDGQLPANVSRKILALLLDGRVVVTVITFACHPMHIF
jgi:hypothetical protein